MYLVIKVYNNGNTYKILYMGDCYLTAVEYFVEYTNISFDRNFFDIYHYDIIYETSVEYLIVDIKKFNDDDLIHHHFIKKIKRELMIKDILK